MFKNFNYLIGLINSDNLVIFKFWNQVLFKYTTILKCIRSISLLVIFKVSAAREFPKCSDCCASFVEHVSRGPRSIHYLLRNFRCFLRRPFQFFREFLLFFINPPTNTVETHKSLRNFKSLRFFGDF